MAGTTNEGAPTGPGGGSSDDVDVVVTTGTSDAVDRPGRGSREGRAGLAGAVTVGGVLIGAGLGGFVDGIVLHQILQWHHLLTDHGRYGHYPHATVDDLQDHTRWDGYFHAGTWVLVVVGLFVLVTAVSRRPALAPTPREAAGLLLVGWGLFNLVEGVVDHHLLTLHHVRDDVADPLAWDLAFLAAGAVLVAAGLVLRRSPAGPGDRGRRGQGPNGVAAGE
ncbi:MAG TPA: DUF2243 domain-containing protein [Acidimicrobiales bacterium]